MPTERPMSTERRTPTELHGPAAGARGHGRVRRRGRVGAPTRAVSAAAAIVVAGRGHDGEVYELGRGEPCTGRDNVRWRSDRPPRRHASTSSRSLSARESTALGPARPATA